MLGIISKFLDSNEKQVNRLQPLVNEVNSFEKKIEKLSDSKLKAKTAEFRLKLERGKTLDEVLPEAFAVVREAGKRTLNMRHYDVQVLAGIVLHQGKIAEQKTGEGKTLTASLALYLNSLTGKGVHLATVNDYLARVGLGWMGPIYTALGISAGCIMQEKAYIYDPKHTAKGETDWRLKHLKEVDKKEAYKADITYGTNNEFGFDYLRDNMVWDLKDLSQRSHHYVIVDEADSILIDEARTPLIISSPSAQATDKYYQFAKLVNELSSDTDYVIDEKLKTANLTEHGITKVEKRLGVDNLYEKDFSTIHHIQQALRARSLYQKNTDYVVKEGEIIIVDEFTGRLMTGRRWSEGLHQAIEAKEGVNIQKESQTLATVSFQNYFRLYEKLAGMTGTAETEAEEFNKIYNVEVLSVPTNEPMIRNDITDVVYKTQKAKFTAVANDVGEKYKKGQPVLIGTTSIEKNEFLSSLLKRKGIKHQFLNAKNHKREAEIIAQAGTRGSVTLATNIAGRGVDIILGGTPPTDKLGLPIVKGKDFDKWQKNHDEVVKLGGLHVVGSERHESRRIDNQLRGRAGRQGDPGSSRFFVSLEDDIMRLFGGEKIANIMTTFKLPEDTPIEHGMVSKAIENAQVKVETHNFDIRKHLVEYDDVANKQREIIYSRRKELLKAAKEKDSAKKLKEEIQNKIHGEISNLVSMYAPEEKSKPDHEKIIKEFVTIVPFDEISEQSLLSDAKNISNPDKLITFLNSVIDKLYAERNKSLGEDEARNIEKFVSLSVIDTLWIQHLDSLDDLREGIGLRAAGQRDPLVEYKKEAYSMFEKLLSSIDYDIIHRIFKVQVRRDPAVAKLEESGVEVHPETNLTEGTKEKSPVKPQSANQPTDPNQLSDEQLDAEIARLEKERAEQKSSQQPSSPQVNNPFDSGNAKVKVDKIGRNDPCPCGSGLKWKKCGLVNAPEHNN